MSPPIEHLAHRVYEYESLGGTGTKIIGGETISNKIYKQYLSWFIERSAKEEKVIINWEAVGKKVLLHFRFVDFMEKSLH